MTLVRWFRRLLAALRSARAVPVRVAFPQDADDETESL